MVGEYGGRRWAQVGGRLASRIGLNLTPIFVACKYDRFFVLVAATSEWAASDRFSENR
jgi:hypothetical protein